MALSKTWDESDQGSQYQDDIDDLIENTRYGVRERAGVEHNTYADETGYTDVWLHKISRDANALPGDLVVFALSYGNRGGALATNVLLTDALPVELSFVSASLLPITTTPAVVWNVGELVANSEGLTIVITTTLLPSALPGSTVTNTASIAATSPELETGNNPAQATLFVGQWFYLPVICRQSWSK